MLNFGFRDIPDSKAQRLKLLEEFLITSDADGKVLALIIDEAHQLSPELLEEVRLFGNFERADRKLLQIVLVGQNQLNDKLNLPQLWQLKQRITIRLSLRRLDREAVEEYVRFRWAKAGGAEPIPFTSAAIDGIASWSNGIPRLINIICDNALLIAFAGHQPYCGYSDRSRGLRGALVADADDHAKLSIFRWSETAGARCGTTSAGVPRPGQARNPSRHVGRMAAFSAEGIAPRAQVPNGTNLRGRGLAFCR